jgi:hypothetical protein
MDPQTIATTAVSVLAPYLTKAGEKAVEEVGKKLPETIGVWAKRLYWEYPKRSGGLLVNPVLERLSWYARLVNVAGEVDVPGMSLVACHTSPKNETVRPSQSFESTSARITMPAISLSQAHAPKS